MSKSKISKVVWCIALILIIVILGGLVYGYYKKQTLNISNPIVTMEVENFGTIKIELYPEIAPESINNFITLANNGFYNGLKFHRVVKDFMIQGGDPDHNGGGGSDKTIKGEFSSNGVENNISHVRGVISMARANDPNSASSQFFIVQADSIFLDGNYAAFGKVIEGMEVVDKIESDIAPLATNDNGTIPLENQPIINTIKVVK